MITLKGYSDDIVYIKIGDREDEIGCTDLLTFKIGGDPKAGVIVTMLFAEAHFSENPGWAAVIHPWEEDMPCPWPISVSVEGHSAVVTIDCPDDTPISWPGKVSQCSHCGQEVTA